MKILKLLSKNFYFILFSLFIGFSSLAEDQPADIWNIEQKTIENPLQKNVINLGNEEQLKKNEGIGIYNMQSQNKKKYHRIGSNS